MPTGLQGQCAVVTGATRGIGRAVAMAFGRAGVRVAVNHRSDPDAADEVVRAIADAGGAALSSLREKLIKIAAPRWSATAAM